MRRVGVLLSLVALALAATSQAHAADPPNDCPVAPPTRTPPRGYVHGGLFSSNHTRHVFTGVTMQVDQLGIRGGFPSRDHAHGTMAIQNSGPTLSNYLEVGIGVFGHRNITSPRFWSFYREEEGVEGTFELISGAPIPQLGVEYRVEFHYVGGGQFKIRINGVDLGFPYYVPDSYWFTVFNENYNENNTLCDLLHVSYKSSTDVLDRTRFDHQFDACHWQSFFSWEVYWWTDQPLHCFPPDPDEPPDGETPPDFPSSPVAPP